MKRDEFLSAIAALTGGTLLSGCEKRSLGMFAVGAASSWRSYEVYDPTVDIYTVTSNQSHDATISWFQDRWFALWDDGTEAAGQRIRQSTSFDLSTWTTPIEVFTTSAGSVNPVTALASEQHYQPALVIVDGELMCFWSDSSSCYLSKLSVSTGLWTNSKLYGISGAIYSLPNFDGYDWSVFPSNGGIVLDSGRILVPITLQRRDGTPFMERTKRDSVIYSDDNGVTWSYSEGTKLTEASQWEATVWEPSVGVVNMFARNNRTGVPLIPKQNLKFSSSADEGETWVVPQVLVPIETAMSRMHVVNLGERNAMAHNDWALTNTNHAVNRRNLSLFFNRGNGFNFTPAVNFAADDVVNLTDYPQIGIHGNTIAVIYTWQALSGMTSRQTKVAKITPLPDPNTFYIYPRKPRGLVEQDTVDSKDVLRFHNDSSSAGLDLETNDADIHEVTIELCIKIESGTKQTLLAMDEPSVKLIAQDGDIIVKKWQGGTQELVCGTYSGWTDISVVTGGGITNVSINGGAYTTIALSPVGPMRAFLGENFYSGITEKPGAAFVVDIDSIRTKVE